MLQVVQAHRSMCSLTTCAMDLGQLRIGRGQTGHLSGVWWCWIRWSLKAVYCGRVTGADSGQIGHFHGCSGLCFGSGRDLSSGDDGLGSDFIILLFSSGSESEEGILLGMSSFLPFFLTLVLKFSSSSLEHSKIMFLPMSSLLRCWSAR